MTHKRKSRKQNISTTDKSNISVYDPVYFHITLSGGEPGAKTRIKYVYTLPSGETGGGKWDAEWFDGYSGDHFWENGIYQNPAFGTRGKLSVKYYDGNGNLIGEKSVQITS